MRRFFVISYLIVLAVNAGVIMALGAFVAPTLFHTQSILGDLLSHYQEGLLMTAVFAKSNLWLIFVAIYVLLYELYDYKHFRRDKWVMGAAFVVVFTSFMFVYYYTPDIISYQAQHQTQSEAFKRLHLGSELDFKLLLGALLLLLIRRFMMLVQKKS